MADMVRKLLSPIKAAYVHHVRGFHSGTISFDEIEQLIGKSDPVILEIGANDGEHTLMFLERFPKAQVHAFEPEPRAIERWKAKVADPRAQLHEIAIAAEDGTTTFFQSDGAFEGGPETGWDYSGSIRAPKNHVAKHPQITFDKQIEVTTQTLDSWCAAAGVTDIDFVWADTQGAEKDVILGGPNALSKTRYLYTEYNNSEFYEGQWQLPQIEAALPNHKLIKRWRNDVLFERT